MLFGDLEWTPAIGDPTIGGWFTVFAYFATARLCSKAFNAERTDLKSSRSSRSVVWLVIFVVMCLLGVNKQLDVQTLFTEIGRKFAESGGWYESRKSVQVVFITFIATMGISVVTFLTWQVRHSMHDFLLPLVGLVFVALFVVIRAASFHGFDSMISSEIGGIRLNWILELTGIGLIACGAYRQIKTANNSMGKTKTPATESLAS